MTVVPRSHKGDSLHSDMQAVLDEKQRGEKKKINALLDFSTLNPSGIIGVRLVTT